jgi:hypothetical protein
MLDPLPLFADALRPGGIVLYVPDFIFSCIS